MPRSPAVYPAALTTGRPGRKKIARAMRAFFAALSAAKDEDARPTRSVYQRRRRPTLDKGCQSTKARRQATDAGMLPGNDRALLLRSASRVLSASSIASPAVTAPLSTRASTPSTASRVCPLEGSMERRGAAHTDRTITRAPKRNSPARAVAKKNSADLAVPHRIGEDRTGPSGSRPAATGRNWTETVRCGRNSLFCNQLRRLIRSDPVRSRRGHGSPPASRSASDDDEPTRHPCAAERRHAQTPDPARRHGDHRPVPLGRLRPDGRVPLPEADPHRQPGRPLGRAGSARLHRQPSPSRLGAAPA